MSRRHMLRRPLNLFAFEDRLVPATIAWSGAVNSNWSVAGNWTGGVVPGAGDVAQFNAGAPAVTVDTPQTVTAVEFNGGWNQTATLTANLTTTGAGSKWDSGTIASGTWNAGGTITLNGATVGLTNATLNIIGTLNHVTANNINTGSAAMTVAATGTYDFQSDGDVAHLFGNAPVTNVSGVVKKTAGTGVSIIPGLINNQGGTWNAVTGTLVMASGGGTHTGGTFMASAGAGLDLTGGGNATWKGSYTGSGGGVVYINSGTATIDPAGATFNFPANLFEWDGGTINAGVGGKLTNASTGFITLNGGAPTMSNLTFSNAGTFVHKTGNNLNYGSSTITNDTSGVMDFQADGDFFHVFGNVPIFNNKGLIKKTAGTGVSSIRAVLNNQGGTWDAQTGTLQMQSDGAHTGGTFMASLNAAIDVTGGLNANWTGSYTGSGLGLLYQNSGTITAGGGGATFNFPAGLYEWNGGTIASGTLTNTGTIKINGNTVALTNATLLNQGTINHATGNNVNMNSAQVQNDAAGTYDFQADGDIIYASGAAPTVSNKGLIRKSSGAGDSSVDGAVSLTGGIWEAQTGSLILRALNQLHTAGTFKASAGAFVNLGGGSASNWKGTFTGSGAGTIFFNDSMTADATGATWNFPATTPLHWSGGTLTGGTWTNTGFMVIDSNGVNITGTTLVNSGTITHTSANNVNMNSAQLQNTAAGVYDFQGDGDIAYASGVAPIVTNNGLFKKSTGGGDTFVDGAVSVPGAVWEAQTGTLRLRALGQTHTGGLFKASGGATLNLGGGTSSVWKGSFTGSGAGVLVIADTMTADAGGATWNFPAASPLHWSAGTLNGGTWTNTGFMVIDSGGVNISNTTLINSGTITHTTGNNINMNSAQLQNTAVGVYDFQSDGDISYNSGVTPIVTNNGLFKKSTGAGNTSVDGAVSVPGGVWEAQAGTLSLRALGQTHTGGQFTASAGAVLNLGGGAASVWKGTFISSGAGVVQMTDLLTADAAGATWNFQASTPLHWSAGGFNGGTWTNTGFIVIDGSPVFITNTTLVNSGTITHTTGNDMAMNSAALQVTATGLYDFQSDADIAFNAGFAPTVTNSGLIRKSGGVGVTQVPNSGSYVSVGGLIDVQTGAIQLPTTYSPNKGGLLGKGSLNNSVNNADGFVRPGPISGTLTVNGNYTQGADGLFIPEMKGTTVADFTTMQVNGTVTLSGILQPQVAYTAKVADSFTIISNDGTDAVSGAFSNVAEGGSITAGNTTFSVTYKGGTGNDVVLTVTSVNPGPVTPPKVLFVAPNGGGAQRSRVTSLLVQFDQPIVQAGTTAAAFQLVRQSDSASVTLGGFDPNYFNGVFSKFGISPVLLDFATLTFISGPVDFGSLADGRYTLTIQANQISSANGQLDGDGNGTGGDNYSLVGTPANGLFRLFGDANGDGTVAANDFIQFRLALGGPSNIFDFDGDGAVAASDFIQFRLRFGGSI